MKAFKNSLFLILTEIAFFTGITVACAPPSVAIDIESPAKWIEGVVYARVGEQITFVGTANLEGDTTMDEFNWTFDDGQTTPLTETDYNTSRSEFVYTFQTSTVYTVTLSAEDNGSLPGTSTCTFYVLPAGDIYVPDYFVTIQKAIDYAENGDIVVVSPGTYFENIDFSGKNIIVKSTAPTDPVVVATTIINGNGIEPVVSFDGIEEPNSILAGFTITSEIPDPYLKAYWKLDESDSNSVECALANYDGTIQGDPNWQPINGHIDGALQFYGDIDSYAEVNYSSELNPPSFTISFWAKVTGDQNLLRTPICSRDYDYNNEVATGYNFYVTSLNVWSFWTGSGGNRFTNIQGPNAILNKWTHIAGTFEAVSGPDANGVYTGTRSLYVNGALYAQTASVSYKPNTTNDFYIGRPDWNDLGADTQDGRFHGLIDDVRIYDRALDDEDIELLFAKNPTIPESRWTFDNDANSIVYDSVSSNNGTLQGDPCYVAGYEVLALDFDGIDDYVDFGDSLNNITVPFSVSAWINVDTFDNGVNIFNSDDSTSTNYYGFWLQLANGATGNLLIINYGDGTAYGRRTKSSDDAVNGDKTFPSNEWVHVTGVVRGPTDMDLFANSVNMGGTYSGSATGNMAFSTAPCTIASSQRNNLFFEGKIDDVRVYDRALSKFEVRNIYSFYGGGVNGNKTSASITNCVITGNKADYGGGIYAVDGAIINCTVTNNTAIDGGGIADCNALILNSVIADNTAEGYGGGFVDCLGNIVNCTVTNNTALYGGGLSYCTGTINNNIIWGNEPNQIGNSTTPNYSCIESWITGGTGNISSDPSFVDLTDPNNPNYHLAPNSPCVDAGDPNGNYLYQLDIDGQDRVMYTCVDMGADEVYDTMYISSVTLPFLTSFESYQGYASQDPNLSVGDGWLIRGSGDAQISQCSYWTSNPDPNDPNLISLPYQYVNIDADTSGTMFLDDEKSDNSYVRINCIPTDGLKINLMYGGSKVASVSFGEQNDDNIYVLDNGSYLNTSVSYQSIVTQCNTYFNDPCNASSYDDTWVDLVFDIDWSSGTYDVSWTNWNNTSGAVIKSNANFDSSYDYLTGIMFDNTNVTDSFKLNRVSVTDEELSGGVIGPDDDIKIVSPTGKTEEGHLTGKVPLQGSVWYDKLGQYCVKSCALDLDPYDPNSDNWVTVDQGTDLVKDDVIGNWDTSAYNNGQYLLKLEVYNDIGQLHTSEYIQRQVHFNQTSKDTDVYFSVAGKQKAQTFYHQEKPDISVKWPGQFPFELTRTYNNYRRKYIYPFFYGWTHNHDIRITENAKSDWLVTNDPCVPDGDVNQLGISSLWLQTANGTRMFECKENTSTESDPNVIYKPIDNLGGYIARTSQVVGTNPNGDPNLFDVAYVYHQRDGSSMEISGQVETNYYNSTEGFVDWTVHAKIDRHSDRFGNALIYTWQINQESNYPKYITKIENNCTSARIEFENNFDFFGTPVDLHSKAKLVVGEGAEEEVVRTLNYKVSIKDYIYADLSSIAVANSAPGITYEVTRDGSQVADTEGILRTTNDSFVSSYWYLSEEKGFYLVGINGAYGFNSAQSHPIEISKRICYDEDDRLARFIDRFDCYGFTPPSAASYLCDDYAYNYDISGNLITTKTRYANSGHEFIQNYWFWEVDITEPFIGGVNRLKDVVTASNKDGAVIKEITTHDPDAVYLSNSSNLFEGAIYSQYGDTKVKNYSMAYGDSDNPLKPTAVYEYFDERVRFTNNTYNSYGDIISKTLADVNDLSSYTSTEWDYHPKYGFKTRETSWQGYSETGSKVETKWVFGDADGTVDETNGKYFVQQKKLLDDLNTSDPNDDVWAITYFEYYDNGLLKKKTDPEDSVTFIEYFDNGSPKKVWLDATFDPNRDPNSTLNKRYYYDDLGQLIIEADNLGSVKVNSYDDFGRVYQTNGYIDYDVMSKSDAEFYAEEYLNGTAVYDANAFEVDFGYDVKDNRTFEKTPSGGEKYMAYYDNFRNDIAWVDYDDSSSTFYEYYPDGSVSEVNSHDTYFYNIYDLNGKLTSRQYQLYISGGQGWVLYKADTARYYGSGKKKSEWFYTLKSGESSLPLAKQKNYHYDIYDRLIRTVVDTDYDDPNELVGIITDYGYDAVGNRTYIIDPNCNVVFTDYDNANRKVREYFAVEPNFIAGTDLIDLDTTKSHAIIRRKIEYYNNDKIKSVKSYDYDGDVLALSLFKYDGLGRITETTQMVDDVNDIDAVTNIEYYDEGLCLTQSTDPNTIRDNTYHIKVTDAEGKDTYIGLNAFGKRARTLYPSGDKELLLYNGDGTIDKRAVWDPNNVQLWVDYSYNGYGKMTGIDYPDTENPNDVLFEYDSDVTSRVNKVIDRRYIADSDQIPSTEGDIYEFTYDALNNITSYTYTSYGDPNTWTVDYEYNYVDNQKSRISVKDPNSVTIYDVHYDFDNAGRMANVYDILGVTDPNNFKSLANLVASFDYDNNGNRKNLTYRVKYFDTVTMNYSYSVDNLLTSINTTSSGTDNQPTFSFDASGSGDIDGLGRLVSGTETLTGTSGTAVTHDLSYSYDGMGQLTSASVSNIGGSSWSIIYNLGKDGNITSLTVGGDTVTFKYDSDGDGTDDSDLMTKIGDDSLSWNLNGNLDNSVTATFDYDYDNKLRYAFTDSNSIEIRYDPRGNRIYKGKFDSDGNIITERKYIVDIVGKLPVILCEIDPNDSSLTKSYIYANSQILAQDIAFQSDPNDPNTAGFDRYFYLHDRLGSVRQVIDCNALTVATYTYNPYGQDFEAEVSETIYNPFKYTGQWYDAEISQYYLRARQYDPQLMRFSGRDPMRGKLSRTLSLHRYIYCRNEPINNIDLDGRMDYSLGGLTNNMGAMSGMNSLVSQFGGAAARLFGKSYMKIAVRAVATTIVAYAASESFRYQEPLWKTIKEGYTDIADSNWGNFPKMPKGGGKITVITVAAMLLTQVEGCADLYKNVLDSFGVSEDDIEDETFEMSPAP